MRYNSAPCLAFRLRSKCSSYSYEIDIKDPEIVFSDVASVAQMNNGQIRVYEGNHSNFVVSSEEHWKESTTGFVGGSMEEYNRIVEDMILKSETGLKFYSCKKCSYSRPKNHLQEHVGKHIKGFLFTCSTCEKTFESKKSLRNHTYRSGTCNPKSI